MGKSLSAEEVREQYLRDMGPQLGPIFYALSNELTWLHAKWKQYRQLYGHSSERLELLNSVAVQFFRVIQLVIWDDVVLHLARLTDPQRSAGKDTLTLLRLPSMISEPELAGDVSALVRAAKASCSFAIDWRNRRLAHRELKLVLESSAEPLPGISRKNVEDALGAFRAVLHKVECHYCKSETYYQELLGPGDGDTLAFYLGVAVRALRKREERVLQGRPLPEDFEPLSEA